MGFDLTSDAVYTLCTSVHYTPGGNQRGVMTLYAAGGTIAYHNVWEYASTGAPGQSIEARLTVACRRGSGTGNPSLRFFKAGRWSGRAPG